VYYCGDEPFSLETGTWRGATIFSAPRGPKAPEVSVRSLRVNSADHDLAVLDFDRLRLGDGHVEGAVYVGDRLFEDGQPAVKGNLVIKHLRLRAERSDSETLGGRVEYDGRIQSGRYWLRPEEDGDEKARAPKDLAWDRYSIGLCPRFEKRRVFRSPEGGGGNG
jgi:hypothetical protein